MIVPPLPTELWRLIIRSATFTGIELDGPTYRIDDGWFTEFADLATDLLKTKIAIILVSRHFRQISSEFLHEHFFIDNLRSVSLADSLIESSPSGRGPCQTIKFVFAEVLSAASRTRMAPRLANLLRLCRN
ncbi:hypothetical protein BD410DRAFT_797078, partial [Rickenella mellea]